ncbi:MAG: DNA (cytosine-5-)-methyltransferase [Candidatus Auribacterota bacterium]|nr:DNA (cytosine-5-)-methyltransferase [Candidatus Auribacterota bacterium]
MAKKYRFIDLFAGIGGTRLGFEQACKKLGLTSECVFSSEIKEHALSAYKKNFSEKYIAGDIQKVNACEIPDFDFLLAGFPCQPFSAAGSRHGFMDTRGTLFFDIERILKEKKPDGFLLENVEGLLNHDKEDSSKPYGRTLETILEKLRNLGYKIQYKVLNAADFGVPQNRKRIYILGSLSSNISLEGFTKVERKLIDVLERDLPCIDTPFSKRLLKYYSLNELNGKAIKDKRGGSDNIHSWDIELKGKVSSEQKKLLSKLLKQRRQKKWAASKGIVWMDGMPLTYDEIKTFCDSKNLRKNLDDLVSKGYLRFEHPKDVVEQITPEGKIKKVRAYATHVEKGYNIVTGKLSFEISKILDVYDVAPTLVATDVTRLAVTDISGIRRLSVREGLRLSGFPDWYSLDNISYHESFDLLGNTVIVPVITAICEKYLLEISSSSRLVA